MNYFIDLFSPETYERFSASDRSISGFRIKQRNQANRVKPGDKFICYMTKLSRWIGVLEVLEENFIDHTPIFSSDSDPFIVRFRVKPLCWLQKEYAIPIHDMRVWKKLSFTRDLEERSNAWNYKVRASLGSLTNDDGSFLEKIILEQIQNKKEYSIDEEEYERLKGKIIKRSNGEVTVTIPEDSHSEDKRVEDTDELRTSLQIQAKIASIGEKLGFSVWIPKSDRSRVERNWSPSDGVLLESLPLNYDEVTLRTIEQIDVIWLKRRSIVRAFEIEHTTSVYSGILRMADLLALQPNMEINLHIVAPESRRERVFQEVQRPVFSLLDKGPLSKLCSFLPYESINEIHSLPHLSRMLDTLIQDYEEFAE